MIAIIPLLSTWQYYAWHPEHFQDKNYFLNKMNALPYDLSGYKMIVDELFKVVWLAFLVMVSTKWKTMKKRSLWYIVIV